MSARPLVALDLGSTKVACAIGLPHEGGPGFELLGSSLVPYPASMDGWLGDPLSVSRTIEQAMEATALSGDFHRAVVAISHPALGCERVRAALTLADEPVGIRAQDLTRLQNRAVDQAVGVDREPLHVERLGFQGNGFERVLDPRGLAATRIAGDFHIVTVPVAARRAVIQAVESAGLEIAKMTYSLQATVAAMWDDALARKRVLAVDLGGLTTNAGVFHEGRLTGLASVSWGGQDAARDLAARCQVTGDQAMALAQEGLACRRAEVTDYLRERWAAIGASIATLLDGQPKPDALLVGGRGALMDGFVEWLEQATALKALWCRSARMNRVADVSRQVGLSTAIGLLELMTQGPARAGLRPERLVDRLISRTRTILTEYF